MFEILPIPFRWSSTYYIHSCAILFLKTIATASPWCMAVLLWTAARVHVPVLLLRAPIVCNEKYVSRRSQSANEPEHEKNTAAGLVGRRARLQLRVASLFVGWVDVLYAWSAQLRVAWLFVGWVDVLYAWSVSWLCVVSQVALADRTVGRHHRGCQRGLGLMLGTYGIGYTPCVSASQLLRSLLSRGTMPCTAREILPFGRSSV